MSLTEYQSPKILFLKNVFINDCVMMDDFMEQKLLDEANDMSETKMTNDKLVKLPQIFTTFDIWPKKTEILCWHCDRKFLGIPVFIPKTMEPNLSGRYIMNVEGCFCSFNCAMSYITIYYPKPHEKSNKIGMLHMLFKEFYGKFPDEIIPAPSKYKMIQYNGNTNPRDYYAEIRELQKKSGIIFNQDIQNFTLS